MISWAARLQRTVALSTAEAEFMALAETAKEAQWLRALLRSLGYPQDDPTVIWEDNQSCILLTKHNRFHARSKHIDIRYHFICEMVENKVLAIEFLPSSEMTADILIKGLGRVKFEYHRSNLGINPGRLKHQVWEY